MLLDREVEQRISRVVAAVASSFSVFAIGRELGQTVGGSIRSVVGMTSASQLTFLEQSYLAGKAAALIGTDALRTMTEGELTTWLQTSNLALSEADVAIVNQLRGNTERWLTGRSAAWEQKIRTGVANADREWRAVLSTGRFTDGAARTTARNAALQNLLARLKDGEAGMQGDVDRIVQSEMHHYFQEGQVSESKGNEIVYKVPRATACPNCMRIHLNVDGTPRKYRLDEVSGNSNYGLPAYAWRFTIGPVHPYCYCMLYREMDRPTPNEKASSSKRLKKARREILKKSLTDVPELNSCGMPNDPDLIFEDQWKGTSGQTPQPLPPHQLSLIRAVKRIAGNGST